MTSIERLARFDSDHPTVVAIYVVIADSHCSETAVCDHPRGTERV